MYKKIAACVVLYNPSIRMLSNIQSYYPFVDCLIAVDNSESKNCLIEDTLLRNFDKSIYNFLNANLGIAAALNVACITAVNLGFDWLLTMDQDSSFPEDNLKKMIEDITVIENQYSKVGIIAPYRTLAEGISITFTEPFTLLKITMTSGSLLNLKAYKEVGRYDETLFMDYVDYEYCIRLRKNNYKIIQDNRINLKHSLGNFQLKRFLWKKIAISNHNYQRRYYITRNSLQVGVRHYSIDKIFFFKVLLNIILYPFAILCFEDDKLAKLKSMFRGVVHFLSGKSGKIQFHKKENTGSSTF